MRKTTYHLPPFVNSFTRKPKRSHDHQPKRLGKRYHALRDQKPSFYNMAATKNAYRKIFNDILTAQRKMINYENHYRETIEGAATWSSPMIERNLERVKRRIKIACQFIRMRLLGLDTQPRSADEGYGEEDVDENSHYRHSLSIIKDVAWLFADKFISLFL